jgi:lysophospholipase L1-like esterase
MGEFGWGGIILSWKSAHVDVAAGIRRTRRFGRWMFLAGALLLAVVSAWADDDGRLGKLVVVGDSLSAGFQNFSLYDSDSTPGIPAGGQKHGYSALIAQQAGVNLNLPLISYTGIPPALSIDVSGHITRPASLGSRENPLLQTLDLSVPGFTVADALSRSINLLNVTNPIDGMALDVLAFPGLSTQMPPCGALGFNDNVLTLSAVVCAVQQTPNTVLVSIGNNDALQSLTLGIPPTDTTSFATLYAELLGTLASTSAKIVVTNIPDVSQVPFLVSAPAFQAKCHFPAAGAGPADFVVANLANPLSTSGDICVNYAVRPGALIAQTSAAVKAYNVTIAMLAAEFGAAVVDINGLLARIAQDGYQVGGQRLTTAFLGGLFSLDGMHPSNTGYAILANEIIKTMNSQLDTEIPLVSVEQIANSDPLVPAKKSGDSEDEQEDQI